LTETDRTQKLIDLVALNALDGIGNIRLRQLFETFDSADNILAADPDTLADLPGISPQMAAGIKSRIDRDAAAATVARIRELGWSFFLYDDSDYPLPLKNIADRPAYLFYTGRYFDTDHNAVAIVGSRSASPAGQLFAEELAAALAAHDLTVVSGLARGIDIAAHRGALAAGGRTLAVFGCSLDITYPPEARQLAVDIAASGACLSEFLPATAPEPHHFPRRNRIISGLSQGVVVIEAAERSGALSTAAHALAQNREVFAVPGSPRAAGSQGTNRLIKDGARLLTSVDDIFSELPRLKGPARLRQARSIPHLTGDEKKILELFNEEPIHIDNLCRSLHTPVTELMPVLLALELKGILRELSGKRYLLT